LFVSSTVTLAVPFGIGRVIDIIYTPEEQEAMVPRLKTFCKVLLGVFIVGAIANFGRVYLMQISGMSVPSGRHVGSVKLIFRKNPA